MFINCPHCYKKVIPMQNGNCPGCGKNTNDTANANLNMTLVEIVSRTRLPSICCICGGNPDSFLLIERSCTTKGEPLFIRFMVAISNPFRYLIGRRLPQSQKTSVEVVLPICEKCKNENVEPRHVDFENRIMTFAVHKNLKDAILKQNSINI